MTHAFTHLAATLLAALAALHAGGGLPGVPIPGKTSAGLFQSLESRGALASKNWNFQKD